MSRVKRGVTARARHKKILKAAKGFYGRRKNIFRAAVQAVEKAGQYAYRDRRRRKRNFRSLWIQRINAAARELGLTYGRFIDGLGQGRHRDRPEGARRSRRARAPGVPRWWRRRKPSFSLPLRRVAGWLSGLRNSVALPESAPPLRTLTRHMGCMLARSRQNPGGR